MISDTWERLTISRSHGVIEYPLDLLAPLVSHRNYGYMLYVTDQGVTATKLQWRDYAQVPKCPKWILRQKDVTVETLMDQTERVMKHLGLEPRAHVNPTLIFDEDNEFHNLVIFADVE